MQQLTFISPGSVEWHDTPAPRLMADDDLLVRPITVATCDLDAAMARGRFPAEGPFALGHEFIGEVVETGGRTTHSPGDIVAIPFQISCGACERCRRGLTGNCTAVPARSMYGLGGFGGDWGGALSDLVRVPFADHMAVPVPAGVDPMVAASVGDNISDAWRAVAPPLEILPGSPVLVVGGGGASSIGLYAIDLALAYGAESVTYVDHDPNRLTLAEQLGATIEAATGEPHPGLYDAPFPHRLGPFPITVDASAHHSGIALAMRSTEPGGICTNVGVAFEFETPIPMLEAYGNGLELHIGRAHARVAMPEVLDLIAEHRLRPDLVTTVIAPWSDAADVLADPPTKAVITR